MIRRVTARRKYLVRILSLMMVSFLLFSQTGCWNAREINELAFVLSIALDKADSGFKVTAQVAKPEQYSKTPSGSASSTEKEKPFWIISGTGRTIFEAVRNMASISPRRIFWSHIKIIIIGEELAKSDIREILDFFSRNPELRFRTLVAVAPGKAADILEVVPTMEKDPSFNIEKIIEKVNLTGKGYRVMLKDFLEDYLEPNLNPVASKIILTSEESKSVVKVEGASVFDDTRLVGWLDETETRGLLWIENKISGSVRVVDCPYDGLPVTLEISQGKTKVKSTIDNGTPFFTITANATGKLTEKACTTYFTDPVELHELEKALASSISDDIKATVAAAQRYDSDFLDFSGVLHREHMNEWDKISANWPQIFSKVKYSIQVEVKIPEVSLLAKPVITTKAPTEQAR